MSFSYIQVPFSCDIGMTLIACFQKISHHQTESTITSRLKKELATLCQKVHAMPYTSNTRNNYAFYYIIEYKLSFKIFITSSDNVRIYCFIMGTIKWIPSMDSALETAT